MRFEREGAGILPRLRRVDPRPIGVFDSGMGGLTVLHECLVTLPHEDFVYLGDGARLPYGPRPLAEIRRFASEIGPEVVRGGSGPPRLDLWRANAAVLRRAGIPEEGVEILGRCTSCEREHWFSHRRDAGRTGRQAAFIAPRPPAAGGPLP